MTCLLKFLFKIILNKYHVVSHTCFIFIICAFVVLGLQPITTFATQNELSSSSLEKESSDFNKYTDSLVAEVDHALSSKSTYNDWISSALDKNITNQQHKATDSSVNEADSWQSNQEFKPDSPFLVVSRISDQKVIFTVKMFGDSYLYKSSIRLEGLGNIRFKADPLPEGVEHEDALGKNEVYFKEVSFSAPIQHAATQSQLVLHYQGCDEIGICYPPMAFSFNFEHEINNQEVSLAQYESIDPAISQTQSEANILNNMSETSAFDLIKNDDEQSSVLDSLQQNFLLGLLICFLLGIALDLTPCVLPMLPIFSAMIIGPKKNTVQVKSEDELFEQNSVKVNIAKYKPIILQNMAYALGLSITYMILGLLFSTAGASIQSVLQSPIMISFIAILLLICAAACAGIIELKLPDFIANRLRERIYKLNTQSMTGAFMLGTISALIASPCTSAPLAGALLFALQSGDMLKGALAFFAIGLGMATPLFFIGIFGSKFLMRSGIIGDIIKRILVIVLVATAFYLSKHLLGRFELIFATLLTYIAIIYTVASIIFFASRKAVGTFLLTVIAFVALVPTYVAYNYYNRVPAKQYENFQQVSTLQDYAKAVSQSKLNYIAVTANWCTNCKIMEKDVYSNENFIEASKDFNRLVINITDSQDQNVRDFINEFKIIGVPFYIIINDKGEVIDQHLGLANLNKVMNSLSNAKNFNQQ